MVKKILLGFLFVIMLLIIGGYAYYRLAIYTPPLISDEDRTAIEMMPLPAKIELNSGNLDLAKGLKIHYSGLKNEKMSRAFGRLLSGIELKTDLKIQHEGGCQFEINCLKNDSSIFPQPNEDESYELLITRKKVCLTANSSSGILYGLESVLQLIKMENGSWVLPALEIQDSPRFQWRGLMLDVCRHWIPKDVIIRTLDAMSAVKMNVLHWHLSEDQGFRVESKVFPRLHEIGSNGQYYTQDEITEVVQYAADRGIRVIPEFDLPGHSKSWQIAYPELSTVDFPLSFGTKKGEGFGPPIDPTKESVYEFLDQFIGEMANLFPDPYFHIGGDEVNPKYWNENDDIHKFMEENAMEDYHDLQAYFNKRMYECLTKHGKLMLGWDEILHSDLGEDIVVQSWRSHKSLFEAVQRGGTAMLSAGYYMDHILPAGKHYQVDPLMLEGAVDIEPDTSYWKMYDLTIDFAGNVMESQLVIFDRNPEDVFGYFAMMDGRSGFKGGTVINNQLKFKFQSPAGELEYVGEIIDDSIAGTISLALLGFDASGVRSGGSDMPGAAMPKVEVMKPLTEEEKSRIIGGEACQWSEFVDSTNIESRLWPRTAAIAEKLWSPQELTNDENDMYRRLLALSKQLTLIGSLHDTQYKSKLKELISTDGLAHLLNLTDFLEEVKYHGRMGNLMKADDVYLPHLPLDRIVDAVRPESLQARMFNQRVDNYLEEKDMRQKEVIIAQLKQWQYNHDLLEEFFNNSEKLGDVERISEELSIVSQNLIALLDGRQLNISKEALQTKLSFLETGEKGVVVAIVPGLRNLLTQL